MALDPDWEPSEGAERHTARLTAARAGDRAALDALIADFTPLVWHVARGHGLDRDTAEGVVQTVWLALLRHLGRLEDPRALAAWLVAATCREAQRSWTPDRRAAAVTDAPAELVSEHGLPEDATLLDERDRRLWRAFGRLSQKCQELLRLAVLAGRPEYRPVADALTPRRGRAGPAKGRCADVLRAHLDAEAEWPAGLASTPEQP
ncbi:RNA polymerase sigma factor (sigma-70 family) [Saccharothrix saharensis]|uniref:RNA polymerase sigma factor (Sigma-70 family) n=1 Tax=Saccharothrix saharensis TaxID=571190 RepID=A0A543JNR4_9PSEU|nr:sigma-70 family RNA polymerase sigma factor [Saccharothrix saharensis]TQM84415.1 RNA polymerase sigma factor (sigma-70 family) [Saccharothrix saharensis]